jgi:hypothetical protein
MRWSEVIVRLDGVELGRTDAEGIAKGMEFALRDHSVLRVWLERGPRNTPFLYLTRNGHPLPGSEGDPVKILWATLVIIWGIATAQIFFSAAVIRNGRGDAVIDWNLALGSILALLGILAWRRSVPAMIAACVLCFSEVLLFFATQAHYNLANVWGLLFALGLFAWLLMRGIKAARELKAVRLPIRHPPESLPHHHTTSTHPAGD